MVKIMMQNWFDISNPQIINGKSNSNGKVNGVFGKMHKSVLDEEFPLLGEAELDDRHNNYELERVLLSPSSTTSSPVALDFENTPVETLVRGPPCPSSSSHTTTIQNLSRISFSEDMSCALEKSEEANSARNVTSCLTPKSRDAPLVDTSDTNSMTEYKSKITYQTSNVLGEPSKFSSNGEEQHSRKPIIHSEEEEIAFLRSLGWEESNEFDEDEGLTLDEILDFYHKVRERLQVLSNILQTIHQNMILSVEEYRT